MVYNKHQFLREQLDTSRGIWPEDEFDGELKKLVNNVYKQNPRIPYTLEIECNSYWGSFEREFIAYVTGILDDVQMRLKHSKEELELFWKEVFDKQPYGTFDEAVESYELLRDYFFETFQDVDDWYQLTFYNIDWDAYHTKRNILKIQLAQPLSGYWEEIIIPRMFAFFDKKFYKHVPPDAKLTSITLLDSKKRVVKDYMLGSTPEVLYIEDIEYNYDRGKYTYEEDIDPSFKKCLPETHVFDEELSVRRNRELVEEHNKKVEELRTLKIQKQAELHNALTNDVVKYIKYAYKVTERQARLIERFVYDNHHSFMHDYFAYIDVYAEFADKLINQTYE